MQITGIGNNYYNYYNSGNPKMCQNPTFGEWYRDVYNKAKTGRCFETYGFTTGKREVVNIAYRNNTTFFRNGSELPQIMRAIVNIHKYAPKIHTRFYGCSNGAEVYSVYMFLLSQYGEGILSKFKPFNAMDIDRVAITKAKGGKIPVSLDELLNIQRYTNNRFNEFFHWDEFGIPNNAIILGSYSPKVEEIFSQETKSGGSVYEGCLVKLNKKYLQDINYSVADVMNDYKNIEPEHSVTGLRNFLPYLEDSEIITLVTELGKRLKKDSCVIIGEYDINPDRYYSFCLDELFSDSGFEKVYTGGDTSFLFKKI